MITTSNPILISKDILDLTRGITYKRAYLTKWEKVKIYFGIMKEPQKVRVEPKMLCSLIPRVILPQPKAFKEVFK